MAQLTRIAEAAGADAAAGTIRERAVSELDAWLGVPAECTDDVDPVLHLRHRVGGSWAGPAAFGSEEFNDHHFHYGYFLAAAALLAEGDPSLSMAGDPRWTRWPRTSPPRRRTERARAAELRPVRRSLLGVRTLAFADGNNQESSSEAVNAWNGLALWAEVGR